ncbi:MAG: hypothetical protein Q9167_006570 [Letrouitia subvulpina]
MSNGDGVPFARSTVFSNGSILADRRSPLLRDESSNTSFPSESPHDKPPEYNTSQFTRRPLPPRPVLEPNDLDERVLSPIRDSGAYSPQGVHKPSRKASWEAGDDVHMRKVSRETNNSDVSQPTSEPPPYPGPETSPSFNGALPITQSIPIRQRHTVESPITLQEPQSAIISSREPSQISQKSTPVHSRETSGGSLQTNEQLTEQQNPLQYHDRQLNENTGVRFSDHGVSRPPLRSRSSGSSQLLYVTHDANRTSQLLSPSRASQSGPSLQRPDSTYSSASDPARRHRSPQRSPNHLGRLSPASSANTPDSRPVSYIDLLNVPYPQPPPAPTNIDNAQLRDAVGNNASLLGTKKTLEMYRANVKKTNDPTIQYEFAIFMVQTAQESNLGEQQDLDGSQSEKSSVDSRTELLREARHILQKLADRSYPFAQYYLADGFASGLFSKGKEDYDRAFPLFVAASKHGHAEAGYRAALCYEFGWGTRKDLPKAVQFYRQASSKNHPGAASRLGRACLLGDMGLGNRYREGIKWLKRAAESADFQYNSAPYELGLLHETGYGADVFQDESYAAQLFTQSADLGHVEANYRLGDAYEHGKLSCPQDPALSVHFYTGAAQGGHAVAMMALCAWYMVGAPPVLDKDENEAYEWARKAAETGLPKAEYAVGYFTEMGIGCRRDPLEANVWYVRAADQGDERAKHRIAAIRAAASGGSRMPPREMVDGKKEEGKAGGKKWGLF